MYKSMRRNIFIIFITITFLLVMKHFILLYPTLRDLLPLLQNSFHFLIPNMFENTFAHCV